MSDRKQRTMVSTNHKTLAPRLPRPNEPYELAPLVKCEHCGALFEERPECCACLNGIDAWDGAAVHYCGRCASRMGMNGLHEEETQEDRILDLERKLSRVLDAAQTMEARLPGTVRVTIRGQLERVEHQFAVDEELSTEATIHVFAQELDYDTRLSIGSHLEQEVHRLGDWSTMQKYERTIAKLQKELREQERRTAVVLDFAEQVLKDECADPDEDPELPGSPMRFHTVAAQRAAYRMGGRDALAELFYAGDFRQRDRKEQT